MRIGSLVRAKHRYIGQLFVVVDARTHFDGRFPTNQATQIKCVRVEDGFKTRYSNSANWEVVC